MTFGEPSELSDGCVLLRPTSGDRKYQELRQSILGPEAPVHGAHMTLLHPRNATGAIPDLASIGSALAGLSITFDTVVLIEQRGCDPWQVKGEYKSAI